MTPSGPEGYAGPRRPIALKIALLVIVLVAASIVVTGGLAYLEDRDALADEIGERLLGIARTAALGIDGDEHRSIFRDDVLGEEEIRVKGGTTARVFGLASFRRYRDQLKRIRDANRLATDVYTFRRVEGAPPGLGAISFVVMSAEQPYIGNQLTGLAPAQWVAIEHVYATKTAMATDLYEDPEGAWISAMAPILAADGTVEAVLEVDYGLSTFQSLLARRRRDIIVFCLIGMTVSLLLSIGVVRWLVRPLHALTGAMHKVGEGDLRQNVPVTTRDEIGFLAASFNTMVIGLQQREFLKSTLKSYVAATVVDQILKNPELVRVHGERRVLTVFFSDVEGFTTLAEERPPEEVVDLLNDYLGHLTEIIFEMEGTLDKYEGDAIVAFWGAPLHVEDHARRACVAALRIQAQLRTLRETWRRTGKPPMTTRIGINTGEAIVGNIGCSRRMDYTAVGDPVNLGARLETANKFYGSQILISEFTQRMVAADVVTRELDIVTVLGRQKPLRVYELLGEAGAVAPDVLRRIDRFHDALSLYRERRWQDALEAFRSCAAMHPGDLAARVYVTRCEGLLTHPPPEPWESIHHLVSK